MNSCNVSCIAYFYPNGVVCHMSSEGYLLKFTGSGRVEPTTPISFGDGEYDEGSNDEQGEQTSATSGEGALPDKKEGVKETIIT